MKKFIILFFISFCGYAAMAQLPFTLGVHAGLSNTKIDVDDFTKSVEDIIDSKAHNGYLVGAFARFNLGRQLYIEPAFNYSHKESEADKADGTTTILKYNTFDIPVMVGIKVLKLAMVNVRAFAGPVASFAGDIKGHGIDLDNNTMMWNGKVGVGVDVWKFTFDIDYEKGFTKPADGTKSPRSFNFTLGFKII